MTKIVKNDGINVSGATFKIRSTFGSREERKAFDEIMNIAEGSVLAGGALRTLVETPDPHPPLDLDIFVSRPKEMDSNIKWAKYRDEKSDDFNIMFICPKSELLSFRYCGVKFQFILSPVEVHSESDVTHLLNDFDFVPAMAGFIIGGDNLYHAKKWKKCIKKKKLKVNKMGTPAIFLRRAFKYTRKGYHLHPKDQAKFLQHVIEYHEQHPWPGLEAIEELWTNYNTDHPWSLHSID